MPMCIRFQVLEDQADFPWADKCQMDVQQKKQHVMSQSGRQEEDVPLVTVRAIVECNEIDHQVGILEESLDILPPQSSPSHSQREVLMFELARILVFLWRVERRRSDL